MLAIRRVCVVGFLGIWVLGFGIWDLHAQRRGGAAPNQLQQALYDMADAIGMLRNPNEVDRLGSMNYWATGTIVSNGQPCKVVDYKASVNWLLKGMRVDYKCEGSPQRHVEVVRDNFAWNETEPGKGGTAAAAAASERALMLWTLPAGAIKAANDAGAATKVATENGKTVVTYPIAALKSDVKLTLNKDNRIDSADFFTWNRAPLDLDGDGVVNASDATYLFLAIRWSGTDERTSGHR